MEEIKMEILEHGKYFRSKRVRCECGCLFIFEVKDIQRTEYGESDGIDTFVICPECKQRNYIINYLD